MFLGRIIKKGRVHAPRLIGREKEKQIRLKEEQIRLEKEQIRLEKKQIRLKEEQPLAPALILRKNEEWIRLSLIINLHRSTKVTTEPGRLLSRVQAPQARDFMMFPHK